MIETGIRRVVAIVTMLLALGVFIPIGLALWLAVIARAVITFVISMVIDALTTSNSIDAARYEALNRAVAFFPGGILNIMTHFWMLWNGTPAPAVPEPRPEVRWGELLVNLAIAILIWGTIVILVFGPPFRNWMPTFPNFPFGRWYYY